ncbi:ComF family protein [Bifidobacterium commune]|uniref:ComF family protein n=1 Tax=Bifidobacterium commune TaxID=1505727 RepID=UPI00190D8D8D|nr:ComF family protein [Bifidobacterium commune]
MYRGFVRHAILAWKDHSDEECDSVFASFLAGLVLTVLGATRPRDTAASSLVLVPAPSSVSSMHSRGRWQTLPLVKAMQHDLRGYGLQVEVKPVLHLEGVKGKSVQRTGASGRSERIAGHVRVDETFIDDDSLFIIVDDIVTTGTTMGHCATSLHQAGAVHVIGVALACVESEADRGDVRHM